MGHDKPELAEELVGLAFDHGIENLALALEICIDSAPSFVGGRRNIVHGCVLHTFSGEELTGNLDKLVAGFANHNQILKRYATEGEPRKRNGKTAGKFAHFPEF